MEVKPVLRDGLAQTKNIFGNENKAEKSGIISNKKCFTVTKPVKNDYSNHLNTKQVWYSNGPNVSDCQIVRVSNDGLKTGKNVSFMV